MIKRFILNSFLSTASSAIAIGTSIGLIALGLLSAGIAQVSAGELVPQRLGVYLDWQHLKTTDIDVAGQQSDDYPEVLQFGKGRLAIGNRTETDGISQLRLIAPQGVEQLLKRKKPFRWVAQTLFPAKNASDSFSIGADTDQGEVKASVGSGVFRMASVMINGKTCETAFVMFRLAGNHLKPLLLDPECRDWVSVTPLNRKLPRHFIFTNGQDMRVGTLQDQKVVLGTAVPIRDWLPGFDYLRSIDAVKEAGGKSYRIAVTYADGAGNTKNCISRIMASAVTLKQPCIALVYASGKGRSVIAGRLHHKGSYLALIERANGQTNSKVIIVDLARKTSREVANASVEVPDVRASSYVYGHSIHWVGDELFWLAKSRGQRVLAQYDVRRNQLEFSRLNPSSPCIYVDGDTPIVPDDLASKAEVIGRWREILGPSRVQAARKDTVKSFLEDLIKQNWFKTRPAWLQIRCEADGKFNPIDGVSFEQLGWIFPFRFEKRTFIAASVVVKVSLVSSVQDTANAIPVTRFAIFEVRR